MAHVTMLAWQPDKGRNLILLDAGCLMNSPLTSDSFVFHALALGIPLGRSDRDPKRGEPSQNW